MTVLNDPPFFKQPLVSNINVEIGLSYTYVLPDAQDEGSTIIYSAYEKSKSMLPPFVTYRQGVFNIKPVSYDKPGKYTI